MAATSEFWAPFRPHPAGQAFTESAERFIAVPAGRRSGKTYRAKRKIVERGLRDSLRREYDIYRYFFAAPTRDQAKAIYWEDLKRAIPEGIRAGEPNATELSIRTVTGAEFVVVGMDKPQRIEGRPWNGGVLDEFADMKSKAWSENVRPALADRLGFCYFVGVPEGRNHYYDLYEQARAGRDGWAAFTWPSSDILPAAEIEAARNDLDELTFRQEFEASFVNFQGRAYHSFGEANIAPVSYDPAQPLALCFDFNVEPGVCVAAQELQLPNGQYGTAAVGEVYIARGSNTLRVAEAAVQQWGGHLSEVRLYGDASGGNRGSAQLDGSDWDIIRSVLRPVYGDRLGSEVPPANPSERSRINAVNSRACSADGTRRLVVDPTHCPRLIRDLEGVAVESDGRISKKSGDELTHISDAFGYYIVRRFPTDAARVSVAEGLLG